MAAYMLAVLGGKENPAAADIEKILSSVGIEADKDALSKILKELKGKKIGELVEQGRDKLSSMPVGGGAAVAAASADTGAADAGKKEEKKEEKKKEETESEDDNMGFGLFD